MPDHAASSQAPIGLVTCPQLPDLDPDDRPLVDALATRGFRAEPVVWSNGHDPVRYRALVLRSCWDYHRHPDAFRAWLALIGRSDVPVLNPVPLLQWNLHKRYLFQLADRGIAIPRTALVRAGTGADLAATLEAADLDHVVVKPAVSLSGHDTHLITRRDASSRQRWFAHQVQHRDMLIQEYLPAVESEGETSFVFLGGRFSHAILKRAAAADFRVHDEYGGSKERIVTDPETVTRAHDVLRAADAIDAVYARVDAIVTPRTFTVIELELIDPSCYLQLDAEAGIRFADAIVAALDRSA